MQIFIYSVDRARSWGGGCKARVLPNLSHLSCAHTTPPPGHPPHLANARTANFHELNWNICICIGKDGPLSILSRMVLCPFQFVNLYIVNIRIRQVFQSDGSFVGKFGTCGRGEGQLEHPHYIAVSNTNRVIVSDSNNHRIQVSHQSTVPTAHCLTWPRSCHSSCLSGHVNNFN